MIALIGLGHWLFFVQWLGCMRVCKVCWVPEYVTYWIILEKRVFS